MSNSRRQIMWPVLAFIAVLVVASCGLLGFTTCNPPDRVEVNVKNIPSDTRYLSLAADGPEGPVSLMWSYSYFGMPYETHPALRNGVVGDPPLMISFGASVRWRTGSRYGVVLRTKTGEWKIAWFPATEVTRNSSKVSFDLSKAEIVPLDADTVKALGLQDVKPMK